MDRFSEMRTFSAVAEHGGFTRAAEALVMSRAAVSRQVSDLESRLGTRLLQRTTRRVALTEEGEIFLERCAEILQSLEEAESELTERTRVPRGRLRMNVPVSYGMTSIAPRLGEFHEQYPQIELDVTLADRAVDLIEEGYDLAIRIGILQDSSLVSRQISMTRLMLCASPGYIERHGRPESPTDLARHQTIAYSYFSSRDTWQFNGPSGTEKVTIKPWMRTNNGDTAIHVAVSGEGIVLQPDFLVEPAMARGELEEILPDYKARELGIHALFPSRKHVSARVRAFIGFLSEQLGR